MADRKKELYRLIINVHSSSARAQVVKSGNSFYLDSAWDGKQSSSCYAIGTLHKLCVKG